GVFIAFFGLQSAGIIVGNPNTLVSFADISKPETQYALGGMLLVAVLVAKGYKTAVMLSIFIMTVLAMFITNSHGVKIAEMPSKIFAMPHNIDQTFFKLDLGFLFRDFKTAFPVIVVLFMMDIFDSLGTIIAMGKRSGLMDENGHMENLGNALTADAFSTIAGALLGTSTTSSFVESATGIQSGAKTGLCALFVGVFFLLSLFFGQLICAIPIQAAAPALIIVGVLMMQGIKTLKFDDMSELIPAVFCMLMIAFSFKISEGLALGVISYVAIRIFTGKAKEIPLGTWLLFLLMVVLLCLC
ncbi:MAG: NCS2 family permease, partial [Opitutales bacterium]|nr:NCS2 family permease [Opitutales bacterium]